MATGTMKWKILLMLILLAPLTLGALCEDVIVPDTECQMLTPSTTSTTYQIFDKEGNLATNGTLTEFNTTIKYFNLTLSEGSYIALLSNGNETREIISGGGISSMGSSWIAIILALAFMTAVFCYFAVNIKSKRLDMLKGLLFLLSLVNAFVIGMVTWIISNNPANVSSFTPVAVAYFGVNGLCLMALIWIYAVHLVDRTTSKLAGREERD
tara:strand:+ start:2734 stop:3366 length:633 start_codon:yes stop_codon:yes gene_type:complete